MSEVSWRLRAADDVVQLDDEAAAALGVEPGRALSADALSGVGASVTSVEGELRLGAWLARLLEAPSATTLARATAGDRRQLLALVRQGAAEVRERPVIAGMRAVRHELNNLLNNIQVNAELARVLTADSADSTLRDAATRIVDECDRCAGFVRTALAEAPGDPAVDSRAFLEALGGGSADAQVTVRCSSALPRGVLATVHAVAGALLEAAGLGGAYRLQPLADDDSSGLVLEAPAPRTPAALEDWLRNDWQTGGTSPWGVAGLPAGVRGFSLCARPAALRLSVLGP